MKRKFSIRLMCLLFFGVFILFSAQVTNAEEGRTHGKIVGRVIDSVTGDLLPSVNITLVGTDIGASSDFKGNYFILGVPVGRYTVRASYIGFSSVVTQNVWVSSGLETVVNFELAPMVGTLDQEIIVDAPRSDVGKLATGSFHIINQDELASLPAENIFDIMNILPGIVDNSFVRGSRATDIDLQIDGISVRDPLFGGLPKGAVISNHSLSEIQIHTGGFSAEYGNAMSGVINLITKEGGDLWTGSFRLKNSFSDFNGKNGENKLNARGEKIFEFAAGGNAPYAKDKVNLFVSGRLNLVGNRTPGLDVRDPEGNNITDYPHNELSQVNIFGKAVYQIRTGTKFTIGGYYGNYDFEEDSWFWRYNGNFNFLPSVAQTNGFGYARLSHFLTSGLLIESTVEYNDYTLTKGLRENVGDREWWEDYKFITDFDAEIPIGYGTNNPYGLESAFVESGRLDSFWRTRSSYIGSNINLLGSFRNLLSFKLGAQAKWFTVKNRYRGNSFETPNFYQDNYEKSPFEFNTYGDISFNIAGAHLNTGMLIHYLDARSSDNVGVLNPTSTIGVEPKINFNPRIGVAYEFKKGVVGHANYGWYYQQPSFHSLYANQGIGDSALKLTVDGDPGLDPAKTVAYEAGMTIYPSNDFSLDITGYYKRLNDLGDLDALPLDTNKFVEFTNKGRGRVYGLETSVSKAMSKHLDLRFSYSYAVAKGTLSFIDDSPDISTTVELEVDQTEIIFSDSFQEPKIQNLEYHLPFDQRHNFRSIINFNMPGDSGPSIYGFKPLQNIKASFTTLFQTGTPYTQQNLKGEFIGDINRERHPWYTITNMRLQKKLDFPGFGLNAFLDVKNLFNRTDARFNAPETNNPHYSGLTLLQRNIDPNDPAYQSWLADFVQLKLLHQLPREVWFGFSVDF